MFTRVVERLISLKKAYPQFAEIDTVGRVVRDDSANGPQFVYQYATKEVPNPDPRIRMKFPLKTVFTKPEGIWLHLLVFEEPKKTYQGPVMVWDNSIGVSANLSNGIHLQMTIVAADEAASGRMRGDLVRILQKEFGQQE